MFVLDAKNLRNIIAKDKTRLKTLWKYFGYHLVCLNPNDFVETNSLTQKEIKKLVNDLTEFQFFENGKDVDVSSFCFLFQGSIIDELGEEYQAPQFIQMDKDQKYTAKTGANADECVVAYLDN